MRILEKLPGNISKADAYYLKSTDTSIEYKGWKLKSTEVSNSEGYSLRAIENGKLGFSGTTKTDALDSLIETTLQSCKIGEEIDLEFPSQEEAPEIELWDNRVAELSLNELKESGDKLLSQLIDLKEDCELEIGISRSIVESRLENTSGLMVDSKISVITIAGEISRVREGDFLFLSDYFYSTKVPDDLNQKITEIASGIKEQYKNADIVKTLTRKKVPLVFAPKAVIGLILPLLSAINGKNIYTKSSPLSGKLGEAIFDPKLTIIDDGTLHNRPKSSPFDDEGFVKKAIPVIENGVLMNYLFDLYTAKKVGETSNGTASRCIFSQPVPSSSNIVIKAGDASYRDIISSIKEGILVDTLLGIGQGNILSGAFSNPLGLAFKIENGEITGRVKNVSISGNIYECLKEVTALSKEQKWRGSLYAPYIRMDNIDITTS